MGHKRKTGGAGLLLAGLLLLGGCGRAAAPAGEDTGAASPPSAAAAAQSGGGRIVLRDGGAEITGGGAQVSDGMVTIFQAGEYELTGTLQGRIVVDAGSDEAEVTLLLNGAEISCAGEAAITAAHVKRLTLLTAEGSENRLVSGTEADAAACTPESTGAAVYCDADLTLGGGGTLRVEGYINNGVTAKDTLRIQGGTLEITAANTALKGSDGVELLAGEVRVSAGNDGVKSTVADKANRGGVTIKGGTLTVSAAGDGISAATAFCAEGGSVAVTATGDPAQGSSKGVKAGTALTVSGGSLSVVSADHALKAGADITIRGGSVEARVSDGKGLSAGGGIAIEGGALTVDAIDDALEAAGDIRISDGTLRLTAGEDGLKAAGIAISGGDTRLSAYRDALDAEAPAQIAGGRFLGLSIAGTLKSFAPGDAQPFIAAEITGSKGCEIRVTEGDTLLLSMSAAYGFNGVLASAPEMRGGSWYRVDTDRESERFPA